MLRLRSRLLVVLLLFGALAPAPRAAAQIIDDVVESVTQDDQAPQGPGADAESKQAVVEAPPAPASDAQLSAWNDQAKRAEDILNKGEISTEELETLRSRLAEMRAQARAAADASQAALQPVQSEMDALGPPPEEGAVEAEDVAATRVSLSKRISAIEGAKRQADLARTRAEGLIERIDREIRGRFARELLTLGPSPLNPLHWTAAGAQALDLLKRLGGETVTAYYDPERSLARESKLPIALATLVLGLGLTFWARGRLIRALHRAVAGSGRSRRIAIAAGAFVARLAVPEVAAGLLMLALSQSELLGETGSILLRYFGGALAALIGAWAVGYTYYSPSEPRLRMSELGDADAAAAARLTLILGVVLFLDGWLVRGAEALQLGSELLSLLNFGVTALGAVAMFGLSRYISPASEKPSDVSAAPGQDDPHGDGEMSEAILSRRFHVMGRLAMRASALLSVGLAAAGYYAASRYAMVPPIVTVGLVGIGLLLQSLVRNVVESVLEARPDGGAEGVSALRLIPIATGFLIVCILIPLLALVWGARPADLSEWWNVISDGIRFGEIRVSPTDFITFLIVFGLAYSLTRLLQSVLRTTVLPNTRLDVGARSALISGVGYVGYTLSALVAITTTGIDLSNLAIVAGALSVGIGFGLQNIVSNFVSGIILLIERPVKTGDWIVVGGTHGTVRRIAVRATEIETFDRATLIVPNSDLISGQVTNMTHGNNIGRVIVPVGVAYGSDVRQVEKILQEVAENHPLVLRYPAPTVLFQAFGESSLDFEIRAFLRDVNYVLAVKSQMNFEIDRRFREAGIEIPFAQRDLNIRAVGPLRDLLREARAQEAAPAGAPAAPEMPGEGIDPTDDAAERPDGEGGEADGDGR